jgi:hypothetical protein
MQFNEDEEVKKLKITRPFEYTADYHKKRLMVIDIKIIMLK